MDDPQFGWMRLTSSLEASRQSVKVDVFISRLIPLENEDHLYSCPVPETAQVFTDLFIQEKVHHIWLNIKIDTNSIQLVIRSQRVGKGILSSPVLLITIG